jgi:hypothetical protein
MFLPFNQLPTTARVWIYQSNRSLSDKELASISEELTSFCDAWAAHGAALKSSFKLKYNRFIVIGVDEGHNMATGCSIDSSVNKIKQLESTYGLSFMDRTQIAFLVDNDLSIESLSSIKDKVKEGLISSETKIFNNLVQTVGDFNTAWTVPASNSWLKRYF